MLRSCSECQWPDYYQVSNLLGCAVLSELIGNIYLEYKLEQPLDRTPERDSSSAGGTELSPFGDHGLEEQLEEGSHHTLDAE